MKRAIIIASVAASLWGGAALAQDKPAFVFTAIPDHRTLHAGRGISSGQGRPSSMDRSSWPGSAALPACRARRQVPGSKALAQGAEDVAFKSYFIANTRTGLKSSKEFPTAIAGKSFTFGSRASTSGRLMPEFYIRREFGGHTPDEIFRKSASRATIAGQSSSSSPAPSRSERSTTGVGGLTARRARSIRRR